MPASRKRVKKPTLLIPHDYNVGSRGAFYRVYARPLVAARAFGHPFRGKKLINITPLVESIQWSGTVDEAGAITGSVTLRNPGNFLGILVAGSKILVQVRSPFMGGYFSGKQPPKQRYETILELIVKERDKQQTEMVMNLSMEDRLSYLKTGEHDFKYVKKKKGKRKNTASYIIKDVCRKKQIPFTKTSIPTTRIELEKAHQEGGTILDFFTLVLKKHNQLLDKKNGKKPAPANWEIHMRTGNLTIRPKRPPKQVWRIDERYFVAEPSYRESTKDFATRVIVTGKNTTKRKKYNQDGTESKRKKTVKKNVKVIREDTNMIKVYGLIEKQVKLDGNVTHERAVKSANSELAKATRMKRELSFSCPALPNIWPGSKVYLHFPSYGMKGLFSVLGVDYHVSGTDGPNMTLTIDAGSVSAYVETAPRLIAIKKAALYHRDNLKLGVRAGRTVLIVWSDKHAIRYTHPDKLRVKSVEIVKAKTLPDHLVPTQGETVIITYTKRRKKSKKHITVRIKNRVTFGQGLVAVTDEGYIPTSQLN